MQHGNAASHIHRKVALAPALTKMCACFLQARSAPPMLAYQLESAAPLPISPMPSGPVPSSLVPGNPVPAPTMQLQTAVNLVDTSAAALLDGALQVPASRSTAPIMQPQPAAALRHAALPSRWLVAAAAAGVPLSSGAALPGRAVSVPVSPLRMPAVQRMPPADLDGSLVPAEVPIPAAAVEVLPSPAAALRQSALSAPTRPLPMHNVQPEPAADVEDSLVHAGQLSRWRRAAAAAGVQLSTAAALPVPTAQPQPAVILDDSTAPVELAIAAEAVTASAAVAVQRSAAAPLESPLPVPAISQPAPTVPAMPAVVPSVQLAVPERSEKVR